MKRALADAESGYYTTKARIGFSGADFFTAPEISPAFASLLALQIQEMDEALGCPDPFYLMEAGPGNGTLAEGLLTIFREANEGLFSRIAPVFFELPGVLEEEQRKRLSRFPLSHLPRWVHFGEDPLHEGDKLHSGVLFGNEFLDALPVHRVRVIDGEWQESYIEQSKEGEIREVWGPVSLEDLVEDLKKTFPGNLANLEGQESEICLEAPKVLDFLDRYLGRGFMLWIDYGDIGPERHSERRKRGTLLSYRDQKVSEDLFGTLPGEADLTAFVDFSQIARHLRSLGYGLEGFTDQMSWLMGLGFPEWMALNENRLTGAEIDRATVLLHPLRMGRIFKVLLMSKGVVPPIRLSGFRYGGLRSPLEG
jgi:SAM-dependent MidA family methyltransferase